MGYIARNGEVPLIVSRLSVANGGAEFRCFCLRRDMIWLGSRCGLCLGTACGSSRLMLECAAYSGSNKVVVTARSRFCKGRKGFQPTVIQSGCSRRCAFVALCSYMPAVWHESMKSCKSSKTRSMITTSSASPTASTRFASPSTSPTPAATEPTLLAPLSIFLFPPHHFPLPLQTLCLKLFRALLNAHIRLLEICWESRVGAVFTLWPSWTETAQVERTYLLLLVVLERAMWAQWAEAAVVMWTRWALGLRVDV